MTQKIQTTVQLYRHLLRMIKQLPEKNQTYYRHNVRQQFKSHSDETDPERIQQIIQKALQDSEWILNKYKK